MQRLSIILFIILCFSLATKAQNLVPNGYFEIHDTCPNNQFQIRYATNWLNAGGTPDYFNACAGIGSYFNVPNTANGYQEDCCNGFGFAGIYTSSFDGDNTAREYIQIKLTDTLKAGNKYFASMFVNRASAQGWAIATMGIFFSDSIIAIPPSVDQFINIPNPQIKNKTVLKDTVNWISVQDTFVASGNEKYLVVGNFSTNTLSDTVRIVTPGAHYWQAYYYIDGVSLYDITGDSCNNYWNAGFDKYIFAGDSIRLGAINTDNSTYTWVNSAGGNTFLSNNTDARPWSTPTTTTTYYITKTCPNNTIFKDTVTVNVQQHIGVEKYSNALRVNIFPNPNNGTMTIEYSLNDDAILHLTDIYGRILDQYNLSHASKSININREDIESGIYFINIKTEQGNFTTRLVIQQ